MARPELALGLAIGGGGGRLDPDGISKFLSTFLSTFLITTGGAGGTGLGAATGIWIGAGAVGKTGFATTGGS